MDAKIHSNIDDAEKSTEQETGFDTLIAEQEARIAERDGKPMNPDSNELREAVRAEDMGAKQSSTPESELDGLLIKQEAKIAAAETTLDPAAVKQEQGASLEEVLKADEMLAAEEKNAVPGMTLDPLAVAQVAAARERDFAKARETLSTNAVEQNIEEEAANPFGNQVESDEMFTARQGEVKPVVPPEIEKQYLHVGDKFYHLKNTDLIAFEDKGNKLETKADSENIAQSMVRIAEARGWDEIKVSGSESFRKEAWLEAASRGIQVKGYTPSEQDKEALEKRLRESPANKIEKENKPFRARENEQETPPEQSNGEAQKNEHVSSVEVKDPKRARQSAMAEVFAKESATEAVKQYPELAGAAAAVAAMDKKAEAVGLNNEQRAIVSARVRENVVNSIERGNIPEVKIKEDVEVKRETRQEMEAER